MVYNTSPPTPVLKKADIPMLHVHSWTLCIQCANTILIPITLTHSQTSNVQKSLIWKPYKHVQTFHRDMAMKEAQQNKIKGKHRKENCELAPDNADSSVSIDLGTVQVELLQVGQLHQMYARRALNITPTHVQLCKQNEQ